MLDVIVLVAGNERGGAASHVMSFLGAARATKAFRYRFACVGTGPLYDALTAEADCILLPTAIQPAIRALKSIIVHTQDVIVHAHGPRMNLIAYLGCRGTCVAWTSTIHSNPKLDFLASRWKTLLLTRLNLFCLKHAVGLFVVNPYFASLVPISTVVFVPNAVQLRPLTMSREDYQQALRDKLDLASDVRLIGVAARLDPVKNLSTLILSMSKINIPSVHLVIAGEGAEWNKLHALTCQLGLVHRVHFLGHINWVQAFYAGLDIHVLTSRSEGLPYSILEAGSYGVPNIATNIPSLKYLIEHGETGLLTEVDDVDMLANAISSILTDDALQNRLVTRFAREVLPKFTSAKMLSAYERGYTLFLGPKTPSELVAFVEKHQPTETHV